MKLLLLLLGFVTLVLGAAFPSGDVNLDPQMYKGVAINNGTDLEHGRTNDCPDYDTCWASVGQ
jgi:hypothetical protein